MKIEDNFLDQDALNKLQTLMMSTEFDWHYNNYIDYEEQVDKFQFFHLFYFSAAPFSDFCKNLASILEKIKPISLYRIKANLRTMTSNIEESSFHVDLNFLSEEQQKQWTTSIFYVNTNDGYTKFEDGTKIESVANRMITFPANMKHLGTSCTDEKIRIVINFNYFNRS